MQEQLKSKLIIAIQNLWVRQEAIMDGYNVQLFGELSVYAQRQLRTLEARETTLCDLIDCIDSVTQEEVDLAVLVSAKPLY